MIIALPETIAILRSREKQSIRTDVEEYNLYYENFINPLKPEYDVKIKCEYGRNYGDCWRINSYPYDKDSFPLTVCIYDENGGLLAQKSCTVELYDKDACTEPFRVLVAIGDSITQGQRYLEHTAMKLKGVSFEGSRTFNGVICHEGRGGYATVEYLSKTEDPYGTSPYVFPKNVGALEYYGDKTFWDKVSGDPYDNDYVYCGYEKRELKDGMIYNREGVLYKLQDGKETVFNEKPEWEFNFSKYMEQQNFAPVDAISILIGENDVSKFTYDDYKDGINKTLANLETMLDSIRDYDKNIPIILNLPVMSASEQFAFGQAFACRRTYKEARLIKMLYIDGVIEKWGAMEDKGIFICPMSAAMDTRNAFRKDSLRTGKYYNELQIHTAEPIHPDDNGHKQMGDALSAVIQKLRISKYNKTGDTVCQE